MNEDILYCPFKKDTYYECFSMQGSYVPCEMPKATKSREIFTKCIKEKCAMWQDGKCSRTK